MMNLGPTKEGSFKNKLWKAAMAQLQKAKADERAKKRKKTKAEIALQEKL